MQKNIKYLIDSCIGHVSCHIVVTITAYGYRYSFFFLNQVDGSLSLDENIADNGGLKDSYRAFKKLSKRKSPLKTIGNYTLDQLFFIGFGTVGSKRQ